MVWFYLSSRWALVTTSPLLSIPLWSDFIPCRGGMSSFAGWSFQSHYGLILSQSQHSGTTTTQQSFNPTMVWFYPISDLVCSNDALSILSIPLWSDFIWNQPEIPCSCKGLSIPLWSDFIVHVDCWVAFEYSLSIPLWSDFIDSYLAQSAVSARTFQSHYGLILSHTLTGL